MTHVGDCFRRIWLSAVAGEFGRFRERLETSPLRRDVLSTYSSSVPAGPAPFVLHVLPDCFVDILWGPNGQLRVAGPDTRWRTVTLVPGEILAIRFRRGAARPLLGVPVSELTNSRVRLADLWGREAEVLTEHLEAALSVQAGLAALRSALLARVTDAPGRDRLVDAAAAALQRSPKTRIVDLCEELGVSDRHLRRRFQSAVGYRPKTLQRILRMHRFLRLGREGPGRQCIAELANVAGFVDQAHLTNECVELMGFTPAEMLRIPVPGVERDVAERTVSVSYKSSVGGPR